MASESVHGTVHLASAPAAGVRVSDGRNLTVTDKNGAFALNADDDARFLFVSTPRGTRCDRWFIDLRKADPKSPLEFLLEAAPERDTESFTMLHATDIHVSVDHDEKTHRIGDATWVKTASGPGRAALTRHQDLGADLQWISEREPGVAFFAITGDLANSGLREELEAFREGIAAVTNSVHCIPGNHDYMDTEALERNYEDVLGPRYYSFDVGHVHFAAIDWWEFETFPQKAERQREWLHNDLASLPEGTPIVVLSHDQPDEHLLSDFRKHRILATLSGHRHASRVYFDGQTTHFNAPTLMFGGYDHSPRCYRILRFNGESIEAETRTLRVDPDQERLTFTASGSGAPLNVEIEHPAVELGSPWTQFHGDSGRTGVADKTLSTSLSVAWHAHVGGSLNLGGPVVSDYGLIICGVQHEDHPGGGLVALDATSGEERWRVETATSIKRTPALHNGLAIAATVSGEIIGVDVRDGTVAWNYQLGDPSRCWIYTAPVVHDGAAYLGEAFHFAALDAESGTPRWIRDDFGQKAEFANMSSPAAMDDILFAAFLYQQTNFCALDPATGETRWSHDEGPRRPAIGGAACKDGRVYIPRGTMWMECVDASSGELHWKARVNSVFCPATPAIGEDALYVVSGLGTVQALGLDDGEAQWTWQADEALLETAAYMNHSPNTTSPPILAGDTLFVPSNCGKLTALDAGTGAVTWQYDAGVPLPGAPAASGNALFLPAADGTITALVSTN